MGVMKSEMVGSEHGLGWLLFEVELMLVLALEHEHEPRNAQHSILEQMDVGNLGMFQLSAHSVGVDEQLM